jgi:hypothetical protein
VSRSDATAERDLLLGFSQRVRAIADDADQASVEIRQEIERRTGRPSAAPDELARALAELADTVAQRLTALSEECDRLSSTLERSARAISEAPPDGPANWPTDEAGSHSRTG